MKGITEDEFDGLVKNIPTLDFWGGRIKVPKSIVVTSPAHPRDISGERRKLLRDRKNGEKTLGLFIKNNFSGFSIIEQFPIIIEDRSKWLNLVQGRLDIHCRNHEDQWTFFLDYYIPEHKIAIEVDYSNTHDLIYDEWRDKYLMAKYGIQTVRLKNYLLNKDDTRTCENYLRDIFQRLSHQPYFKYQIEYREYVKYWLEKFHGIELSLLEHLRLLYGQDQKVIEVDYYSLDWYLNDVLMVGDEKNRILEEMRLIASLIGITIRVR